MREREGLKWGRRGTYIPVHTNPSHCCLTLPLPLSWLSVFFCYQTETKGFFGGHNPILLPMVTGHAMTLISALASGTKHKVKIMHNNTWEMLSPSALNSVKGDQHRVEPWKWTPTVFPKVRKQMNKSLIFTNTHSKVSNLCCRWQFLTVVEPQHPGAFKRAPVLIHQQISLLSSHTLQLILTYQHRW